MKPTVADKRNPNLLILRVPVACNFLDTEEVRGSSPPGPTIHFNNLAPSAKFPRNFLPVVSYLCFLV
jgi:hypothetical protein